MATADSTTKKMNLMQLTVIVAVNMMGSGIIMLPTNMAQVGAISLLSWGVTAIGSMAIAYGFAQCGIFNNRPGGMAAYAEDSYGKPGYFMVFLLYFFSLAIGNVAIAISAVVISVSALTGPSWSAVTLPRKRLRALIAIFFSFYKKSVIFQQTYRCNTGLVSRIALRTSNHNASQYFSISGTVQVDESVISKMNSDPIPVKE